MALMKIFNGYEVCDAAARTAIEGKAPLSHTHSDLQSQIDSKIDKAGGVMNDGAQISRDGEGSLFIYGRDGALIRTTTSNSANGFNPVMSAKSDNGSWDMGTYTGNVLHFSYITDENYNSDTNTQTANIYFQPNGSIIANNFYGNASTATTASMLNDCSASSDATGNTVALRDANGYLYATYLNQSSSAETPNSSSLIMYCNADGFLRKSSLANVKSVLGLGSAAYTNSNAYASSSHNHDSDYVAKVSGKGLSTNDYTTAEKNKLSGIESGANNYAHPSYTARTGKPTANQTPAFGGTFTVSQITSDSTGHVTGATDRTITIPNTTASTSANGLMTKDMVTKLDGIAANANNYSHPASGVTAGTYKSVTVNSQGHVTNGSNPTTLSGYGITDALSSSTKYAASASVGGSATSAVKLDTATAGSATKPAYFSGGKPAACTYSLNKDVPSNASFSDTHYTLEDDGNGNVTMVAGTTDGVADTTLLPIANGGTGATTATVARANIGAAPLASPAFTGTPTAPTANKSDSSEQIATTAFAKNVGSGDCLYYNASGTTGSITLSDGIANYVYVGIKYTDNGTRMYYKEVPTYGNNLVTVIDRSVASSAAMYISSTTLTFSGTAVTQSAVGMFSHNNGTTQAEFTTTPVANQQFKVIGIWGKVYDDGI